MVNLPNDIFLYILSLVPKDRSNFSNTAKLIKQIKNEMEFFIHNYLFIIDHLDSQNRHYYLSFSHFYFIYKKFKSFEKYFYHNRLDRRFIIHRFLLYI